MSPCRPNRTVQEIIDFGVFGWAPSRLCGLWFSFWCVNETAENTASVNIDPACLQPLLPAGAVLPPPGGVNFVAEAVRHFEPVCEEQRFVRWQLPLACAFTWVNVIDAPYRYFRLVAAGKSYLNTVVTRLLQLNGFGHVKEANARVINEQEAALCSGTTA